MLRFVEVGRCTDDLNDGGFRFLKVCGGLSGDFGVGGGSSDLNGEDFRFLEVGGGLSGDV